MKKINFEEAARNLIVLAQDFPECFTLSTPQPLKTGIKDDILKKWGDEPKLSKNKLNGVLFFYTNSAAYLNSFRFEPARVDLEGNPVEEISAYQKTFAYERFLKLYGKKDKKRDPKRSPNPKSDNNKRSLTSTPNDESFNHKSPKPAFAVSRAPLNKPKVQVIRKKRPTIIV